MFWELLEVTGFLADNKGSDSGFDLRSDWENALVLKFRIRLGDCVVTCDDLLALLATV